MNGGTGVDRHRDNLGFQGRRLEQLSEQGINLAPRHVTGGVCAKT